MTAHVPPKPAFWMRRAASRIWVAVRRAGAPIGIVAGVYVGSLIVGVVLATSGSSLALDQRDAIVRAAQSTDVIAAYSQDDRLKAAFLDFGGNVAAAALTSATGLAVVGSPARCLSGLGRGDRLR